MKLSVLFTITSFLIGCTFDISRNEHGSVTLDTYIYANSSNVASVLVRGACNKEAATVDILDSSIIETTTCSSGSWSVQLNLSSYPEGTLNLLARITTSTEDSSTTPLNIFKDTIAPDTASMGTLADGVFNNSQTSSPSLSWSAATDNGSGIDHYELAIGTSSGSTDVLNWADIGNITSTQKSGLTLTEGSTYYPSLRAVDKAGNISVVVSGDGWVVDTTAPSLPLSFKDMNFGSILESPLMTWDASTETGSGLASYQVALGTTPGAIDALSWQSIGTGTSGNITSLSLTNGQIYYPSLRALDNAGNVSSVTQDNGFRAVDKWKNQEPALPSYLNGSTYTGVLQPDNKRIIGGTFTTIEGKPLIMAGRLNTDGTRDSTFDVGTGFNIGVKSLASQSDGKILVAGYFTSYNGAPQNRITRLSADGTKDSTFNIGTGFDNSVTSLALQSDGKILVGGYFTSYNGTAQSYFIRLNTDGTRDATFELGTGFNGGISAIVSQSDGKILVGGYFTSYNGTAKNCIIRLNINGTPDTTFNVGTGFDSTVNSLALQSDGKILVGGNFIIYDSIVTGSAVLLGW